ncbi:amidase [Paenibacillus sinopodophylli]|uniref:amidase n=1 Tax=Paenibacillus sinopodophylli TaxID=1837342 RepID=UPI0014875245|nr:amidase [Paenibacillus sinopodophylli]
MNRNFPWTIASAGRAFRDGSLTPSSLLNLHLQQIEYDDTSYRTFITIMKEEALMQARQSEQELKSGLDRGPLHGISLSVKDMIAYAGIPMTNGSGRTPPYIPSTHAYIVQQLLEAGAIIIGKSHLQEFAYGKHHPEYGSVLNPYHSSRLPGGSSSGSAAGVAAQFALGSIGTDSAGSIRVPSSFCGVVGFKPSINRLSLAGVTPLAPSLDHAGIITNSCEDASLLFGELDLATSATYKTQKESDHKSLQQHANTLPRVGVPLAYLKSMTEPEICEAVLKVVHTLEKHGAITQWLHDELPIQQIKDQTWAILHYEAFSTHSNLLLDWASGYSDPLQNNLRIGQAIAETDYKQCLTWRDASYSLIEQLFGEIDVLITPTCPVTAGPIHDVKPNRPANGEFTPLANLWGLPALSLPIGLSHDGMPIGLQITGLQGADWKVLAAGVFIEQILDREKLWLLP